MTLQFIQIENSDEQKKDRRRLHATEHELWVVQDFGSRAQFSDALELRSGTQ